MASITPCVSITYRYAWAEPLRWHIAQHLFSARGAAAVSVSPVITYTTVSVWSSAAQLQRLKNWFSASKVVQELRDKLRTSRDGWCSSLGRSVTHDDRKGTPTLKAAAHVHEHPYYTITHRQEYDIMMCVLAHMQHKHTYWRRKHRKRYQERPTYHALNVLLIRE